MWQITLWHWPDLIVEGTAFTHCNIYIFCFCECEWPERLFSPCIFLHCPRWDTHHHRARGEFLRIVSTWLASYIWVLEIPWNASLKKEETNWRFARIMLLWVWHRIVSRWKVVVLHSTKYRKIRTVIFPSHTPECSEALCILRLFICHGTRDGWLAKSGASASEWYWKWLWLLEIYDLELNWLDQNKRIWWPTTLSLIQYSDWPRLR